MEKKVTRDLAEVMRDEMYLRDKITDLLRKGPKTIPEIAAELGYPSHEVMIWVMGMRRYGLIIEMPKERADDYYQYRLRSEEEAC
jgi:predicted Rossmann fold nucleotide-binding protein DprA/Smf involved in DNA uptake